MHISLFNRIKLRSSYSVMTYHKEGPACGKIPCDPTSSEADCECPLYSVKKSCKKSGTTGIAGGTDLCQTKSLISARAPVPSSPEARACEV